MSQENNITRKQHYIPQVYLRGFSPEYLAENRNKIPLSHYTVYCYNLIADNQKYEAVPINSICFRKDLYEVTGKDGEIVLPNHLEKFFTVFEKKFSHYRRKLEHKAFIEDNYKTKCFLASEEKVFWVTYILIQLLRIPQVLQVVEETSLDILGNGINEKQAKNIARMTCLPFFKEIKIDDKEAVLFNSLLEPMLNMTFGVRVDRSGLIITSDMPVYIYSKEFPCKEYGKIIFPISSQLCLFLFGGEVKKKYPKNFLFPVEEVVREEIIKSMAYTSFEKIYSNHRLNKSELRYINEAIKDREEDRKGSKFSITTKPF